MRRRAGFIVGGIALLALSSSAVGAPTPTHVRFTAVGDIGTSSSTAGAVLSRIGAADPDAHFALGDLSYGVTGEEQSWCDFVTSRVGSGFPFELITGNHESNGVNGNINDFSACLPNQLSGLIGTYGRQYYVDVPQEDPLIRFVMISPALPFPDGTTWSYATGTPRYSWTAAAIDGARAADIPWIVVGMHKPCISVGAYGCDVGAGLVNMLLAKKVDLVLSGHEHSYMRSKQIGLGTGCASLTIGGYNPACVVDADSSMTAGAGTVFGVLGTGGVPMRDINSNDPEAPYFAATSGANQNATFGFSEVDVTPDTMTVSFVRAAGGTFSDVFTLTRGPAPANQAPAASFTSSANGRTVDFDATGSSDPDGTVASYAWAFGDGQVGVGATTEHTYADPGTYDVTLTVTDDDGATDSVTHQVTVSAQQVVADDQFERTLTNTWGTANVGGPWTVATSPGVSSVSGGKGRSVMGAPGRGPVSLLSAVHARDVEVTFELGLDKVPAGSNTRVDHTLYLRRTATGDYRAMVRVRSDGAVFVDFVRYLEGAGTTRIGAQLAVPDLTYGVSNTLVVKARAAGAGPTNLMLKVWKLGTIEPAGWTITRTDATTSLQAPGSIGLSPYLSAGATNAPVQARYDNLVASLR